MNRLAQDALVIGLARRLAEQGSWCGETHIQKAGYLLRELLDVPIGFDFILYKHGPFSFGLRDELGTVYGDKLLVREPQEPPYGPRVRVTERGLALERSFARTLEPYQERLDWLTARLGSRGVLELERLATALWVTRHSEAGASVRERAIAVNEVKPHVSLAAAGEAVEEIDALISDSHTAAVPTR